MSDSSSGREARRPVRRLPRRPTEQLLLLVALVSLGAGCASSGRQLQAQVEYLQTHTVRIHEAAYACAEREIAMAEAHLDFGEYEMERGSYLETTHHLDLALENLEAAMAIVDVRPECWPDYVADSDGDGILDDVDQCPLVPEDFDDFQDADGCPELDNDGDDILDVDDECPEDPEDFDLFEDEDGCPEADNDGDRILDVDDECPNQPEDFDNDRDDDGCPEEPEMEFTRVTDDRIEISEQIHFAHDSDEILPDSFPILDEIAIILDDYPTMEIRIEGHTDSSGSSRYNLQLSDRRASSVRSYLIRAGISPHRMVSVGFGEERPIASNDTDLGRAANRRVEFHIIAR